MGGNADLNLAVNTGNSLILSMKLAQHPAEGMPACGVCPSPPCYEKEEQLKPSLCNPLNPPASQKTSAAERHYFSHALETPFLQGGQGGGKPTYRSASRARRPSPQAAWVPGHPGQLGHHLLGSMVVRLPSPALPSVTHGTSLSLISLPGMGLGTPACHPMGHSGQQQLGAAVLREGKKKSFLQP